MPQLYQGARPQAWRILFIMASLGAGVGSLGYFSKLSETLHTLPSLQATYGGCACILACHNLASMALAGSSGPTSLTADAAGGLQVATHSASRSSSPSS